MKARGYIGALVVGMALGVGGFFALRSAPAVLASTLTPEQRAALQAQYDDLQKQIAQYQQIIDDTKDKEKTLQGDVSLLNAQIAKAQAEIKQRNNTIAQLQGQISEKAATVQTLQEQLQDSQDSLGKILRERAESDTVPLAILALSSGSLSDFFSTVSDLDSINVALQTHMDDLRGIKSQTEAESVALAKQQNAQVDARYSAQQLQQQVSETKQQKNALLTETKGQEAAYNQVLADKQKQAEEIRSALFDLRDTKGISFSTALSYANVASQKTGVRAAMILAILSQESDLGNNIGSCVMTDLDSGDGKGINTGSYFERVMKAPRDTVPFEDITDALGLDWRSTPVSCPLGKTYSAGRGYGGALGPSQFIPSTWQLFSPRIDAALGMSGQANPWDPQQAIMATALYLKDLGAAAGGYTAERNAACKYYSGRSCDTRKPTNYTYGNSVIAKAETFQNNIDFLNDNNL